MDEENDQCEDVVDIGHQQRREHKVPILTDILKASQCEKYRSGSFIFLSQ